MEKYLLSTSFCLNFRVNWVCNKKENRLLQRDIAYPGSSWSSEKGVNKRRFFFRSESGLRKLHKVEWVWQIVFLIIHSKHEYFADEGSNKRKVTYKTVKRYLTSTVMNGLFNVVVDPFFITL